MYGLFCLKLKNTVHPACVSARAMAKASRACKEKK